MGDGRILVQATVTAIGDDHFLYPCCLQCYSKLLHDVHRARWRCLKCGVSCLADDLEWRYRLRLTIADTQEYRQVAVFGKTVQPFFGASANTFQRFLNHLQKTESDLADIVLKQAVECVFVGHSFLFGFASATKQKPIMTVSCLSNVKETKGNNSDLIAVQMICPDQNQLTTVSQQMSLMFKEILSNSLHQLSSADDSKEESFSKSRSWNRKSSNGSLRSCFNSILEISENCSMNSIASLLLSCENSFLKNITVSPGSLSSYCVEIENEQLRLEEQNDKYENNMKEEASNRYTDDTHLNEYEGDETRFDFVHNPESEATRSEELTFLAPYDDLVHSEDLAIFPQDLSPTGHIPENSFHDSMNDSSLLLADKDDCLQLVGERMDANVDGKGSCLTSRTGSNESNGSEIVLGAKKVTKIEENQSAFHPQDFTIVQSVMDNEIKGFSQPAKDNNEWEEMPYSEDLDEFLANAYGQNQCEMTDPHETIEHVRTCDTNSTFAKHKPAHCERYCDVTEPLHETIEQARTSDANSTLIVMNNIPSMICQDDKHEDSNRTAMNCSEISFKMKRKDEMSVSHNQVTAVSMIAMPESENLDEFLQIAAIPQIDLEDLYDHKSPIAHSGAHMSFNNLTNNFTLTTPKHTTSSVTSPMGNWVIIQDTEAKGDSSEVQEDLEMYFANSFSPDGSVDPSSVDTPHQQTSVTNNNHHQKANQQNSCNSIRHCQVDQAECDKNIVDNKPTCDIAKTTFKDIEQHDCKSFLDQIDTCHVSYEAETTETAEPIITSCQKPPGYLFHPVASIGSLNYSNDLFDTSGDLFDSSQAECEGPPCDSHSLEPKDSCMEVPMSQSHQSAVCESIDESHEACPVTDIQAESESYRKQVKFARRLSHISTVQLIDIRMKLNFGTRGESQSTPVKSCIRNRTDAPRRMILGEGSDSVKQSLFMNKQIFGLEDELERTTNNDIPVGRNILVEDSEPISDVSIENSSSDESICQNNNISKDADLCTLSQDLFACSQPMDTNLDDIEHDYEPVKSSQRSNEQQDKSFTKVVTGSKQSTTKNLPLQNRRSLCSGNKASVQEIPPYVMYASPCDGSPLLFSQIDHSVLDSKVTSTPAEDPGHTDLILPLTPDLFSP